MKWFILVAIWLNGAPLAGYDMHYTKKTFETAQACQEAVAKDENIRKTFDEIYEVGKAKINPEITIYIACGNRGPDGEAVVHPGAHNYLEKRPK